MSIYHWKLGDVALARLSKKVYAKVHVVYDEKGLFYDYNKGISANEDGSLTVTKELCYYVELSRTKQRLWLPYTCLHLAERSRPFYGPADRVLTSKANKLPASVPKKRKIKEDYTLPFSANAKISKTSSKEPDLNTTYDIRHMPLKQGKYENAFSEFVRRGKEMLFDQYFIILQTSVVRDEDCLDYLLNVNASTEDKFEMLMKNIATEKELEHYLHQCWRYNFVCKQIDSRDKAEYTSPLKPELPLIHITWCLVCGKGDKLRQCPNCPAAFHPVCRREWLVTVIHRKNPPQKAPKQVTLVEKILSSTRTITTVRKDRENIDLCPSCMWGPRVGYDDVVWHKLGPCSWWPARVLTPGATPACLLRASHTPRHWPLRYYGTENYSWGLSRRMCLFLPAHAHAVGEGDARSKAVFDAADDYISVYLT